jgi:predicted flavoprotein YhiN
MAAELGHTIVSAVPSLVPLTAAGMTAGRMGLSLKNILLQVTDEHGRTVFSEQGDFSLPILVFPAPLFSAPAPIYGL